MARIARSQLPLHQTRGRPVFWRIRMTRPDGDPLDLTGAVAVAVLRSEAPGPDAIDRLLTVGTLGPDGVIEVTGSADLTPDLPIGRTSQLQVSLTYSQNAVKDYVWPVVVESL